MLIVTADDYGKNRQATDSILECFSKGRITSASGMMFMDDSERAALLALEAGVEVGLHLNFTEPFNARHTPAKLREHQARVISYLTKHRLSQIVYNPFLTNSFEFVFRHQEDQFIHLYGGPPCYYNGHHHMHLCANLLLSRMIHNGATVRTTFTFGWCEKSMTNVLFRRLLSVWISRRFVSTDCFFSISSIGKAELSSIVDRTTRESVEIEVHPENAEQRMLLLSDDWGNVMNLTPRADFERLRERC